MTHLVRYEWIVETIDGFGDVIDIDHRDTASDALRSARTVMCEGGNHYDVGIVRDRFDHDDPNELVDRQWAYVENGKLPAVFDGGTAVPKRFHVEIASTIEGVYHAQCSSNG